MVAKLQPNAQIAEVHNLIVEENALGWKIPKNVEIHSQIRLEQLVYMQVGQILSKMQNGNLSKL